MSLYLIEESGEEVLIDHLPTSTIIYLIRAGAKVKEDSEYTIKGQEVKPLPGIFNGNDSGHRGDRLF
jgi:hypothetical protein